MYQFLHRSLHELHYHHECFTYLPKYVYDEMRYVLEKRAYMQDTSKQLKCARIRVSIHIRFQSINTYRTRALRPIIWYVCIYDHDYE